MQKIEFKNLPDTSTPLSAENLNLLQDNVEDAIDNVSIDLDTQVSTTSTNGVENQAITNYVDGIAATIPEVKTTQTTSNTATYSCNYINNMGGGRVETLWSGTQASGSVSFSESLENFDFILLGIQASDYTKKSELIPASDISYQTASTSSLNTYDITAFQSTSVYADLQVYFENATTLTIRAEVHSGWPAPNLKYVIGIKL